MDNEEAKFWVSIWKIIAATFVAFVLTMTVSCQMTNYQIGKAIAAGAKPLEANCALDTNSSIDCKLLYVQR